MSQNRIAATSDAGLFTFGNPPKRSHTLYDRLLAMHCVGSRRLALGAALNHGTDDVRPPGPGSELSVGAGASGAGRRRRQPFPCVDVAGASPRRANSSTGPRRASHECSRSPGARPPSPESPRAYRAGHPRIALRPDEGDAEIGSRNLSHGRFNHLPGTGEGEFSHDDEIEEEQPPRADQPPEYFQQGVREAEPEGEVDEPVEVIALELECGLEPLTEGHLRVGIVEAQVCKARNPAMSAYETDDRGSARLPRRGPRRR